ncbi:hypothetical protein [Maribellus luteus]|uniref:hypothetical protein n=1 Tax=Maribellus luteus TaxID=2305463 RepID=UPI0011C37302|nr:hypothetical protein [Maribellus luteus]
MASDGKAPDMFYVIGQGEKQKDERQAKIVKTQMKEKSIGEWKDKNTQIGILRICLFQKISER